MGIFGWFKSGNSKSSKTKGALKAPAKPDFRAVEIIPGNEGACAVARKLAGQRFLARQVPMIPLRDCDYSNCHCNYRRHPDRRHMTRRASDLGGEVSSAGLRQSDDRRNSSRPGRRASDHRQR